MAGAVTTSPKPQTPAELYLDLMKRTLTRAQVADVYERHTIHASDRPLGRAYGAFLRIIQTRGFELVRLKTPNVNAYMGASSFNLDREEDGEAMVGLKQLDNVQFCVTEPMQPIDEVAVYWKREK
jgi:hypothetical protein